MRKKIPLIGGIINLIESLKGDIGIIENTDVATHSIPAGSYVIWHNELYKASSAIAVDDALSSSNLTAVSGGAANEISTWQLAGTASGANSVSLPKTFHEILAIASWSNNAATFLFNIPYDYLTTTSKAFNNGYHYTSSNYSICLINATKTACSISMFTTDAGVDRKSEATLTVYYR